MSFLHNIFWSCHAHPDLLLLRNFAYARCQPGNYFHDLLCWVSDTMATQQPKSVLVTRLVGYKNAATADPCSWTIIPRPRLLLASLRASHHSSTRSKPSSLMRNLCVVRSSSMSMSDSTCSHKQNGDSLVRRLVFYAFDRLGRQPRKLT